VVVPVYNEEENVSVLVDRVRESLGTGTDWELVLVNDGSKDGTAAAMARLAAEDARVRPFSLARNYGQSTAMQAGFDQARGDVIVSMDGDLQNDPRDIPQLVARLAEGYDLVAGYRMRRQDKLISRKIPSWIANRIIRRVTGVNIRDNGCSLKAYRRELFDRMRLYSDMHRFIPAMAASLVGARITEMPVRHHARLHGSSKYGISRVLKVLADLLTIAMIRSFRDRPLVMFGAGAGISFLLGLAFVVATTVAVLSFREVKANALVFPGAAVLWFGLSCFLLMLGLIGEAVLSSHLEEGKSRVLMRESAR
jgi:glycosyltransferase involved in cell wall biosynthesis